MELRSKIFIVLGLLLAVVACSDDDFILNPSFVRSDTYTEFNDQTVIELSTFRLDSVQTSNQNIVWVGRCSKPIIGNIHSESYVRLDEPFNVRAAGKDGYLWAGSSYQESGRDNPWNGIADKEVYDSVTIVLRHTGAYEGDTMAPLNIEVKRLATKLEFAEHETEFYNRRWFRDSTSIGRFTIKPCPRSHPRVRFRLNDEFGIDLVKFIMASTPYEPGVRKQRFEKYLGGIKICYNDTLTSNVTRKPTGVVSPPECMVAFMADSVQIVLHSHLRDFNSTKQQRVFLMTNKALQFNHVWNDNVEEPFDKISRRYDQVKESDANLHTAMFEGLGYYTRVNFPNLRNMQSLMETGHIVKATLKIFPERGSYDHRRIPPYFYLSNVNKDNVIKGSVVDANNRVVRADLHYNSLDLDQVFYSADVTYFLNTIMSNTDTEEKSGLVLTWGPNMEPTNYEYMSFNGHGKRLYRSVLEIYYYNYNREN